MAYKIMFITLFPHNSITMSRKKYAKPSIKPSIRPVQTSLSVDVKCEPVRGSLPRDEILLSLFAMEQSIEEVSRDPESHVEASTVMLKDPDMIKTGVGRLYDAFVARADISDAIPGLENALEQLDGAALSLAVSLLVDHYLSKCDYESIFTLLDHENPQIVRDVIDLLGEFAKEGKDISVFVNHLISKVMNPDLKISSASFNALESAALVLQNPTAFFFIKHIYDQESGQC